MIRVLTFGFVHVLPANVSSLGPFPSLPHQVQEMQTQGCIHGLFAKAGSACGTVSLEATARYLEEHCG